jgi:hypothetical protein
MQRNLAGQIYYRVSAIDASGLDISNSRHLFHYIDGEW